MNGKLILWGLGMVLTGQINAQVMDDFSDGNFTANPVWQGDSACFEINSTAQLHLKSTGSDTAVLVTPNSLSDSVEWSFWIKCSFSPSSSNFARIYLLSDQENLSGSLNGYFLQLGEAGSQDAIELFRQDGLQLTSLCRGPDAMVAASFAMRIRVLRDKDGLFQVFADPSGGQNYTLLASAMDSGIQSGAYFGFYCSHTSSNATKFYFDEVCVRPIFYDTEPPELIRFSYQGDRQLDLTFSEPVQLSFLTDPLSFTLEPGSGTPLYCIADSLSGTRTSLVFAEAFPPDTLLSLKILNCTDLSGNNRPLITHEFIWHPLKAFDLVINEIMADPEPQVGLPPVEYLEIYNRTEFTIPLNGWSLYTSDNPISIPDCEIPPHGFLLLCHAGNQAFLANSGLVAGLSSFSISNEGCFIRLVDEKNHLVSMVSWSPQWHQNSLKAEGGYSLEQKDPDNPCGEALNWTSSNDKRGGTPGKQNSVFQANPDFSTPEIRKVTVPDKQSIVLFFTEEMDSLTVSAPANYSLSPDIGMPVQITFERSFKKLRLYFATGMDSSMVYTLHMKSGIRDCAGNSIDSTRSCVLALPHPSRPGDIVFNELMFNPGNSGAEFIELYNRAPYAVDINELLLAKRDNTTGTWDGQWRISGEGRLFMPDTYLVLSADPDEVKKTWYSADPGNIDQSDEFPGLLNEADELFLTDLNETRMDSVFYQEEWHHPMIIQTAGVSLEKIHPDLASWSRQSWHSAASSAGYATPAGQNSQYCNGENPGIQFFADPEVFSPDNDGYQDQLRLTVNLSEPGYQAIIEVYTDAGMLVQAIVNNEIPGTESVYFWDGRDAQGRLAPKGIYVLNARFIHPAGNSVQKLQAVGLTFP